MSASTKTVDLRAKTREMPRERRAWPWITAMIAFVVAVSFALLQHQSLRLDEAQSFWQTAHSPGKLLYLVAQDVHVPLYHLLLHLWTFFFGNGVATARVLSLIFFAATIPVVYLIGKENFSRRIGLTAALFLTISPFMNWYGNEIRMYSLLTLFTALNQLFFLRAWRRGGSSWWWYALTALVGVYVHYFFLLVLFTEGAFYLTHRKSFRAGSFAKFTVIALAVVAVLSPWLHYVVSLGSASNTKPLLTRPTSVDLFNTFSQFLFGFQDDHINTFIVSLWPLTVLLGFLTLQRKRKLEPSALFLAYGAMLPVVFAFLFSLAIRPFYISRYLIVALPALYLFLAWTLDSYSRKVRVVVGTIFVFGMLATLGQEVFSPSTPVKEDYSGAASYLSANASPQDVVVVSAPFTIYPIEYYYHGDASVSTLPVWDRFVSGSAPGFDKAKLPAEVRSITRDHEHTWVLLSYDQGYENDIKSYFDSHYPLEFKKQYSKDLTLYKYKTRFDPVVQLGAQ